MARAYFVVVSVLTVVAFVVTHSFVLGDWLASDTSLEPGVISLNCCLYYILYE